MEVERIIILITQFLLPNLFKLLLLLNWEIVLSQQTRKQTYFKFMSSSINRGKIETEVRININLLELCQKIRVIITVILGYNLWTGFYESLVSICFTCT